MFHSARAALAVIIPLAALALGGCTRDRVEQEPEGDMAESASADLLDSGGQLRARAMVTRAEDGLRVRVESLAMAPGAYGAHIHMVGHCDPPGFTSAGEHWNPQMRRHGRDNPQGQHMGDLPNLLVGADGRGSFEYFVAGAEISGREARDLLDEDGAAILVHAAPDDFRTDPSGNSGARIACGVLR